VKAILLLLAATVTFLAPQEGGQAIGALPIEVTTTINNVDRVEFYVDGALVGVVRKRPFRIAHDFGSSLSGHEVIAKVYSNEFRNTESDSSVAANRSSRPASIA
jgi:Bacterial Ig domain